MAKFTAAQLRIGDDVTVIGKVINLAENDTHIWVTVQTPFSIRLLDGGGILKTDPFVWTTKPGTTRRKTLRPPNTKLELVRRNRRRWLKALRSDKYNQGTGSLRSGDLFCCLGVLCDVQHIPWLHNEMAQTWGVADPESSYTNPLVGMWEGLPPDEVLATVGISNPDGAKLASHNDAGVAFADIADIVEAEHPIDQNVVSRYSWRTLAQR
jgi:hypothetical protein